MGCLSNDPLVLSMYAAFYKVFGAAGASIVFNLDSQKKPYVDMFGSYWGLTAGSLVILLPLVVMRVTNQTSVAADGTNAIEMYPADKRENVEGVNA